MDAADILIKCELCGDKMKVPKILPCQHSFCYSCLKDHVTKDNNNKLKCPRCLEECGESVEDLKTNTFIDLVLNFKMCGVCKQKETDFLCKECDEFFCSSCVDVHNNLKVCDNHTVVKLSDGQVKNQSNPSCIDCSQFLASTSVNSHKNHKVTDKNEGIKRRLVPGQYELELERPFKSEGGKYEVRLDGNYLYAVSDDEFKINVHSLDNFQLLKSINCAREFGPHDVIFMKNKFYVTSFYQKKMLIFDGNGALLDEITLPSNGWRLKNNGSNQVIITCSGNNVVTFDVDTRKLEAISTPSVQMIKLCCSMDDKYCMWVEMNDSDKIITCNHASIIKSYDVGPCFIDICTNDKGYAYVVDDDIKMVLILDGDLHLVSSFPVDSNANLQHISIDSDLNTHLSIFDFSEEIYNIRKYKMK